jgi:hypothetical protein
MAKRNLSSIINQANPALDDLLNKPSVENVGDMQMGFELGSNGYRRADGINVKRVSIYLTDKQRETLKVHAMKEGVSPSELIIKALNL